MNKWDAAKELISSPNAWMFLLVLVFVIFVIISMAKAGLISFKGKGLRLGSDEKELTIVRNQTQWTYLYLMSLEGKLVAMEDPVRDDFFASLVLEKVYDKIVEWITYNHINSSDSYLEIKQSEIKCLVYSLPIQDVFKTPEFENRMNCWVKEIITNLIKIRKEYSEN